MSIATTMHFLDTPFITLMVLILGMCVAAVSGWVVLRATFGFPMRRSWWVPTALKLGGVASALLGLFGLYTMPGEITAIYFLVFGLCMAMSIATARCIREITKNG